VRLLLLAVFRHHLAIETLVMTKTSRSKIAACIHRLLPARLARHFVRQQDGAAAVEFALVALPFLALTFAILETALVFFAGQTLETAVTDSGRLIMTGQAQTAGFSKDDFKTQVCARIYGLFDCAGGIYVDVKTYTSFADISNAPPVNNGQLDTANMNYAPGDVGDIVTVTLYYQWPIYVSLLGNNLANLNGNKRLLVATSVFRNEPYK
jgi:Flp pilus assembly protein TadG